MPNAKKPIIGNFCWVEANVDNRQKAKGFYGELFGWKAEDVKYPAADYTLLEKGDDQVAGIFELEDEAKQQGVRPYWLNYVAVEEIGHATKKAEALGAHVVKAPFEAGPGKMSIVVDPTGAALALWESTNPTRTFVWREPNTMCWQELTTTDPGAAARFYVDMFGWTAEVVPMGDFDYTLLYNQGQMIAGLMPQPKAMVDAKAPSFWTTYFEVADCDEAVNRAKKLGADVVHPPTDIPNIGRFAILKDPEGAGFAIIKNAPRPG